MPNHITEHQLRTAWESRRRVGWPHTFEASMASPLLRRIIEISARHIMRPPSDELSKLLHTPKRPIDQKSKAAGEREEKDDDEPQT